jgi:hypothetical protein
MKILHRCLSISLVLGAMTLATAQSAQSPFSISLATASPSVKAGTDVWMKIQLTNKTQHNLSVPIMDANGVDTEYQYDVHAMSGDPAAKAPNAHPEIQIGSIKSRIVKPGESTGWEEVRVSKVYDLSRPGEYVIQVSRQVPDQKDAVVKSNKVNITVTP